MLCVALFMAAIFFASQAPPDVKTIVERSVAANDKDFAAEPQFNFKEKDRSKTTKTFQVSMIDGSPYQRLLASGTPLSTAEEAIESEKEKKTAAEQRARNPRGTGKTHNRLSEAAKERSRDDVAVVPRLRLQNRRYSKGRAAYRMDSDGNSEAWLPASKPRLPGTPRNAWRDVDRSEYLRMGKGNGTSNPARIHRRISCGSGTWNPF